MGLGNTTFGAACGFTCLPYRMRAGKSEGLFLKYWFLCKEKNGGRKTEFAGVLQISVVLRW
jgi:hypothetical protein